MASLWSHGIEPTATELGKLSKLLQAFGWAPPTRVRAFSIQFFRSFRASSGEVKCCLTDRIKGGDFDGCQLSRHHERPDGAAGKRAIQQIRRP